MTPRPIPDGPVSDGVPYSAFCSCGMPFVTNSITIRKYRRKGKELVCRDCARLGCAEAGRRGRTPRVRRSDRKLCQQCYSLAHRVLGGICRCGLRYAPEPPVTLADVLEQPRGESRTMPEPCRGFRI